MFCPYCSVDHDETTPFSDEHIIPYAMGGADGFTIPVCEFSNNRLGGQVDRPIIEYDTVRSERFFLDLEGTDGTKPTLNLSGTGYVDGNEVDLRFVVGPNGKEMKITSRTITKTPTEDGQQRWEFKGSPEAIRKALEGKIKEQAALGKWVTNDRGEIVTLDNLDQMLTEGTEEFINPSVLRKIDFEHLWTWRFFSKLALASGHYFFGEAFSRSPRADVLRRTMLAQTLGEVELPGVAIWPETQSLDALLANFRTKQKHTIGVMYGAPNILVVSLFGWLEACISLDYPPATALPRLSGQGRVIEIDLPGRTVSDHSLIDYKALQSSRRRGA